MSRRRAILIALALLAVAAVAWLIFHPRVSDKELIERLVTKVEHGVETKSAEEILDCVSPDYRDPEKLTRTDIWKLVMQWVRSPDQADVSVQSYTIEVNGKTATGKFDVQVVLERENGYRTPLQWQFTVQFEKQWRRLHRVWLVKSVTGPSVSGVAEEFL